MSDQLLDSLVHHDLTPMVAYAHSVAEDRFNAGYDLSEVQAAFNTLEESIWTQAVATVEPGQLAKTLGLVSTVLGSGKDALVPGECDPDVDRDLGSDQAEQLCERRFVVQLSPRPRITSCCVPVAYQSIPSSGGFGRT